ncbi:MAG: 2-oxoacid:acceptor oxidoreductase subunit alpha [Deltaproteobacteria bacterium]|nr:2-oxoacid:acceptor oxidoreductase subunit alpha [Deltaproteobacteria bacterium]
MMQTTNILIGGEAGQGLVTIGEVLSKCLVRSGYFIVVKQVYQSRIRGGHNTFSIRVSAEKIEAAPEKNIDLLIALNKESLTLHQNELSEGGFVIADESLAPLATGKFLNTAAIGVASHVLGLDLSVVCKALSEQFGKKDEAVAKENEDVLKKAYQWSASQKVSVKKLSEPKKNSRRLMMNGNDCIALGALAAGVKFCAFYPMTPSTTISLNLIKWADSAEIVVEQAEDEISAINMAIGASFAGATSMVATSGGGFALMAEAVSLAGMTETPVVIVVGQRPGPATGLPTRTEQAELEFILHAGHGEFPRAVFAPGSVEECFEVAYRAFHLAEKYQGPVFLLTDQFLADSFRAVEPFKLEKYPPVIAGCRDKTVEEPYHRHAFTESGISPRLLPGLSKHLVITDSDEHYEDGHITEDLDIRKRMVEKRLKKLEGLKTEALKPDFFGDKNPSILFVSWGSTKGACEEAAALISKKGTKAASLHFSQVWPLMGNQFLDILAKAKKVISVESNATGQFARLIRRETGFEIKNNVSRYDGLPITPEYILKGIS